MTSRRLESRLGRVLLACSFVLMALGAALPAVVAGQAEPAPLRILLTNDDGYDAPGIVTLRERLLAAGHAVIVVAPSTNQSGSSARISSDALHYTQASPDVWSVDGSPADAVLLALDLLLEDAPDLVVSGTNFGQNIGTATSFSGTVGAAVTAARRGIPAIAISAQILADEASARPTRYRSTIAAFEPAAQFASELVQRLSARRAGDGSMLPAGTILNVNYPARPREEVRGVRWAAVSDASSFDRVFIASGAPGEVRIELRPLSSADVAPDTDVSLLAQGYITINLIDANGDAGRANREAVSRRLALERE